MIEVSPESCLSGGKLLKLLCPCVGCLADHNSLPTVRRRQGDTKTSLQDSALVGKPKAQHSLQHPTYNLISISNHKKIHWQLMTPFSG